MARENIASSKSDWLTPGRLILVVLFGIAMGYFEASVVVYLRKLFYPEGFVFPIEFHHREVSLVEVGREAASIAMLIAVSGILGKSFYAGLAYFFFNFAVWDISYYIFLKLLIGWPESLMTWDILFLIPAPWVAPVLAPVLVSLTLAITSMAAIKLSERGVPMRLSPWEWACGLTVVALLVLSFLANARTVRRVGAPTVYPWELFTAAEILWALLFALGFLRRYRVMRARYQPQKNE